MNADLRDYILTLPLDVRQALASIDEPCWYVSGYEDKRVPTACEVHAHPGIITDYGRPKFGHVVAYVPISPVAIALHAAKLCGFGEGMVHVNAFQGVTRARAMEEQDFEDHEKKARMYVTISGQDPTGHRAAIALLQKVM